MLPRSNFPTLKMGIVPFVLSLWVGGHCYCREGLLMLIIPWHWELNELEKKRTGHFFAGEKEGK